MYNKYKDEGLEIFAFPCNNFLSQEPGSDEQVQEFAKSKGVSFPVFAKIDCENYDKTHPLYVYLKNSLNNGMLGNGIKWNFTKFLCSKDGIPLKRYGPQESPLSFEKDLTKLLLHSQNEE